MATIPGDCLQSLAGCLMAAVCHCPMLLDHLRPFGSHVLLCGALDRFSVVWGGRFRVLYLV